MRLTKIQKYLKNLGIEYEYEYEYEKKYGCGEIIFDYNNKTYYISEITGNRGNTIIGVVMNGVRYPTSQKRIIDYLDTILKQG
mgnify:CR=1 FL=1